MHWPSPDWRCHPHAVDAARARTHQRNINLQGDTHTQRVKLTHRQVQWSFRAQRLLWMRKSETHLWDVVEVGSVDVCV